MKWALTKIVPFFSWTLNYFRLFLLFNFTLYCLHFQGAFLQTLRTQGRVGFLRDYAICNVLTLYFMDDDIDSLRERGLPIWSRCSRLFSSPRDLLERNGGRRRRWVDYVPHRNAKYSVEGGRQHKHEHPQHHSSDLQVRYAFSSLLIHRGVRGLLSRHRYHSVVLSPRQGRLLHGLRDGEEARRKVSLPRAAASCLSRRGYAVLFSVMCRHEQRAFQFVHLRSIRDGEGQDAGGQHLGYRHADQYPLLARVDA